MQNNATRRQATASAPGDHIQRYNLPRRKAARWPPIITLYCTNPHQSMLAMLQLMGQACHSCPQMTAEVSAGHYYHNDAVMCRRSIWMRSCKQALNNNWLNT